MLKRYVHGIGSDDPLVSYDGSGTTSPTYLLADERGSIMAETNSAGTVTTKHQYGPYGEPINQSASRFRYTGQILLPGTELYHYKARVYHPKLGRFLQTDPIGYKDGMNWYAYVGNDPMNAVDPDGQVAKLIRPLIKAIKNDGDVVKAIKETGLELGDAATTIMNPASSAADIAGAVFNIVSPVSTGELTKGAQLLKNGLQGAIGEAKTAAKLGDSVGGKQVTFVTSTGARTRADFVTKSGGIVETKTGGKLSPGQAQLQTDIKNGAAVTPLGKNAELAGFRPGRPVTLNDFNVDVQ